MSANLEAKKQVVEEIKDKIQNAKSVVLVSSKGLSVADDTDLSVALLTISVSTISTRT